MSVWRSAFLGAYYHATSAVRWWDRRQALARGRAPVCIVAYHRIADDRATPWTLSHHEFFRQVQWLRDHFELVSLEESQRILAGGENRRWCVSISFDDGYAENCREALPWLVARRIPCTYFVTAKNVLRGQPFRHDLALGQCLAPNTVEQLRALAAAGVEIGVHSYTHADLGQLADQRLLRFEIVAARTDLEEALGRPLRYFAFPFGRHGNLSRAAFELARQAGYSAACSAYGGLNFPGDDPFHLQRVCVDASLTRLKAWVGADRWKLRTPRFAVAPPPAGPGAVAGSDEEPAARESPWDNPVSATSEPSNPPKMPV